MKKRLLALLMALTLCASCVYHFNFSSNAAELTEDAGVENYSVFQAVDALVGNADVGLCGVYLGGGHSIINKISSTKVGVGGITEAALKCRVATNTILEQLNGGSWVRWESWSKIVASGYLATVDETDTVDTGHYYRVRSLHYAASDMSTSYTDSLWM